MKELPPAPFARSKLRPWALTLAFGGFGWFLVRRLPVAGGDTIPLAQSSRALVECAHHRIWSHCPSVMPFGLQQHLLGMFFAWKDFDDQTILTAFSIVNLVVFVVLVVLVLRMPTTPTVVRQLAAVTLLLGPTLVYSINSLGESLSIAVNCLLILLLVRRANPWLIGSLAALSCTSKETAVLGTFLIGAAVVLALGPPPAADVRVSKAGVESDEPIRWWSVDRGSALGLILGCLAGVFMSALFNVWRYGQIGNPYYADAQWRTPGVWLKIKAFAAIWASPGGGAFPYWFLAASLAVGLPLLAARSGDRRRTVAAALVVLALVGQSLVLSAWWTPFGWFAWGPRLILPTLAMAAVSALAIFGSELLDITDWLRRHAWVALVLVSLILLSAAANLGFLVDPGGTMQWFYTPHTSACPQFPDWYSDRDHWYDCVHGLMTWRVPGSLWTFGARNILTAEGVVLLVCAVLIFVGLLDLGSRHTRQFRPNSPEPGLEENECESNTDFE